MERYRGANNPALDIDTLLADDSPNLAAETIDAEYERLRALPEGQLLLDDLEEQLRIQQHYDGPEPYELKVVYMLEDHAQALVEAVRMRHLDEVERSFLARFYLLKAGTTTEQLEAIAQARMESMRLLYFANAHFLTLEAAIAAMRYADTAHLN